MKREDRTALQRDSRQSRILEAALNIATELGMQFVTLRRVAEHADVSKGLVSYAFCDIGGLHCAVMRAAVDRRLHGVIAEGLVCGHPIAKQAPEELRRAALATVS